MIFLAPPLLKWAEWQENNLSMDLELEGFEFKQINLNMYMYNGEIN